jgi:2-oxoglutarate dehydrogenase E2 component (dihydrolipoamide succinyltransferase)
MPIIDIQLPADQQEGSESVVSAWLKKPGDSVAANEPIVEISTDKVTVEIAAPAGGVLREILKVEGAELAPGDILGRIESGAAASAAKPAQSAPSQQQPAAQATSASSDEGLAPAVRRLLKENNLQPSQVPASKGRLSHQDVTDFLARRASESKPAWSGMASRKVPHSAMRRSIAKHMAASVQAAPHVTALFEVDMTNVLAHRAKQKAAGDPPTVTAYLIKAAAEAVASVPEVNSRWHDDHLEVFEDCNIGFGTATPDGGLIVPVISRAQSLTLEEISTQLRSLTQKARDGKLSPDQVQHGTLTISNHGVSGSLLAAPIIIPPGQTAILGAGRLQKRAVVREHAGQDRVEIRPMMYVTLTVDHRALDAQQTNAYMTKFVEILEKWT